MAPLIWLRILLAGSVGFAAWRGAMWLIALSIAFPCLVAAQPNRISAGATALAYVASASIPVVSVSEEYLQLSIANAICLWLVSSSLLSLPWILCWCRRDSARPWGTVFAMILTALPPICVIDWASPLTASGVLFPNSSWAGLLAVLALPVLLFDVRTRGITVLAATTAMLILNLIWRTPSPPEGWAVEQTQIRRGRVSSDLAEFEIEQQLQRAARASSAHVLIFPEGAVRRWTEATQEFWSYTLSQPDRIFVIGAGIPIADSTEFENAVVIAGARGRHPFCQRIPVPLAMWNPFQPDGTVPTHLFGPATVPIGQDRVAILICYEQLLTWPVLQSALAKPSLLVGVSNVVWCKSTAVPSVQRACLESWARLFGLPVLSAVNS
jgi:apolipoprotein N-acyltransferase